MRIVALTAVNLRWETPNGRVVLADVSVNLGAQRTGLVGPNGIGKTTLLRILAGELAPTSGHVRRTGTLRWLPMEPVVDAATTVAQLLGVEDKLRALRAIQRGLSDVAHFEVLDDDWSIEDRMLSLLGRLDLGHLALERQAHTLSGGEITRVLLASAFLTPADFLLLDEPTSHLDGKRRDVLYEELAAWGGGVLIASHDRQLLSLMDRIVELSLRGLRAYGGNYASFLQHKAAEAAHAQEVLESAVHKVKRAKAEAQKVRERQQRKQARGRRSHLAGGQPKVALNARRETSERTHARLTDTLDRKVASARAEVDRALAKVDVTQPLRINLDATRVHARALVAEMDAVSFAFDQQPPILRDTSFKIRGPERIVVAGPNGSGKTTLIRLLLGELAPTQGKVKLWLKHYVYLDQHCAVLDGDATLLDNLRERAPRQLDSRIRWILDQFLFPSTTVEKPVKALSGGERVRAALACVLAAERLPQLVVLDEPANNLDLASLEQITRALEAYQGALMVVSHDEEFLCDLRVKRRLTLSPGAPVKDEEIGKA